MPIIEANVLTWTEWWRRHEWMYTFVSKAEAQTTGDEVVTDKISPQVEKLITDLIKMLNDKYYDVRSAACLALGKIGQNTPTIRNALIQALKDKNDEVQQSALLALGMIKAVEATPNIVGMLTEKRNEEGTSAYAGIALGLMGTDANLVVLQNMAVSSNVKNEVQAGAILGLGLLGDERGAYTLLNIIMGNNKEELQAFAISSLAKIGKTQLTQGSGRKAKVIDIVSLFENRLSNKETKDQVRRAIALALGTIGKEETSIKALENAFRLDRDKGVKCFTLLSLAQLAANLDAENPNKAEVREFLRRALRDEKETTVKGFAALAVGLSKNQDAGSDLLNVFKSNEHPDVRAAAAIGLGIIKYKDAMGDLALEVEKPKSGGDARGLSCVALGMLGDLSAADYLKSVLKDVNVPYLKWMAAMGLAVLRDKSAIEDIKALLNDKNRITREAAIRSIQYFRDDMTIEPLLEQFQKESVDEVRALIVVSLGTIADASKEIPPLRRVGQNINWIAAVRMPSIDLITRIF